MGIYQFDPEPEPHFQFLCEHGAWISMSASHAYSNRPSLNKYNVKPDWSRLTKLSMLARD